jgi:hypothetical protein
MPKYPNSQTAMLLANAPMQPAVKYMDNVFISNLL